MAVQSRGTQPEVGSEAEVGSALEVDVAVLGLGSAGEIVAGECARGGLRVAGISAGPVGGECPHRACIPSKALLLAAARGERSWAAAVELRDARARRVRAGAAGGVPAGLDQPDRTWFDDREAADALRDAGVLLLRGHGRLESPGVLRVVPPTDGPGAAAAPVRVRFRELVICTGSAPLRPPIPGQPGAPLWTSEDALTAVDRPERLAVLGGGPVGCELAQAFQRFGTEVTLIEPAERLLPDEPAFVGERLGRALAADGVRIRTGARAEEFVAERGETAVRLDAGPPIRVDRVLLATGRSPRLTDLGLELLGLDPGRPLPVDEHGRTHAAGVWAAGDASDFPAFTHSATYLGRVIAAGLLGGQLRADRRAIPRTVYTDPAVLCVGATPASRPGGQSADPAGDDLVTAGFDLADTARGYLEGGGVGRVEVYARHTDGRVVGAAGVGPHADDLMAQAVLAVRAELPVEVWADVVQPFPTYAEAFTPALRELAEQLHRPQTQADRQVGTRRQR